MAQHRRCWVEEVMIIPVAQVLVPVKAGMSDHFEA
jgi:hypothetical protein